MKGMHHIKFIIVACKVYQVSLLRDFIKMHLKYNTCCNKNLHEKAWLWYYCYSSPGYNIGPFVSAIWLTNNESSDFENSQGSMLFVIIKRVLQLVQLHFSSTFNYELLDNFDILSSNNIIEIITAENLSLNFTLNFFLLNVRNVNT